MRKSSVPLFTGTLISLSAMYMDITNIYKYCASVKSVRHFYLFVVFGGALRAMSTERNNIRNTKYLLSVSSSTKLKFKLG
jgi:hypothetical protein